MSNQFLDGFTFIGDRSSLVLHDLYTHLEISGEAVAIALIIGVPIGVWLGHIHRFSFFAINVSNIGRALPSLAILALFLPLVGIGRTDVEIALVILAFPPILTNTYVAIDQVDAEIVDAAKGIGLRPLQVLTKVEIPLALPLIFAGIRTSSVFVVATATLAGFFGGGGLGDIINNVESYKLSGVIGAAYIVIALAFAVQLLFILIEKLVTPAGLRASRSPRRRSGRQVVKSSESPATDVADSDEGAPGEGALAAVGNHLYQGRDKQ
jgi:osmoprotectant transport system permease protein